MQQEDGRVHSTIKTVRGVLHPAFQVAVDDDILMKNPFQFELVGVVVNDSVTREAITKDQMRKFLRFVHDDVNIASIMKLFTFFFTLVCEFLIFVDLPLRTLTLKTRP